MSGAVLAGATWEPGTGPVIFDNDAIGMIADAKQVAPDYMSLQAN